MSKILSSFNIINNFTIAEYKKIRNSLYSSHYLPPIENIINKKNTNNYFTYMVYLLEAIEENNSSIFTNLTIIKTIKADAIYISLYKSVYFLNFCYFVIFEKII